MKKHFKIKSIAMICALAVAGIFGISSALINKQAEETPVVEKADAWDPRFDITFYVGYSGSKEVKVWYNAGYGLDDCMATVTTLSNTTFKGVPVYQISLQSSGEAKRYFNKLYVQLYSGGSWSEEHKIIDSWSEFTGSGKIHVYDSNTWSNYTADTKGDVTLYLDAGTIGFTDSKLPWIGYNEYGDVPDGNSGHWISMSRMSRDGAPTLNYWTATFSNIVTNQGLKLRINNGDVGVNTGNFSYNSSYNTYYWSGGAMTSYLGDGSIHKIQKYKKLGSNDAIVDGDPSYLLDGIHYIIPSVSQPGYDFSKWYSNATGSGGTEYTAGGAGYAFDSDTSLYAILTAKTSTTEIFWYTSSGDYAYLYAWIDNDHHYGLPGDYGSVVTIGNTGYHVASVNDSYVGFLVKDSSTNWDYCSHKSADQTISGHSGKYFDSSDGQWKDFSLDIEYKNQGGGDYDGSDAASRTSTYNYALDFTIPAAIKTGYTATWHLLSDCSDSPITKLNAYTYPNGVTLYAKWTVKTSALTFYLRGADGGGAAPTGKTATYGSAMPAYGNAAPTKTGYTFGGFYDGSTGSGTQYYTSALASARNWDKDITSGTNLYAKWTAHTFSIAYNNNGGSGTMTNTTGVTYDSTSTLKASTFTKAGHTFKEWNTQADGKGSSYSSGSITALQVNALYPGTNGGTRTLYAIWTSGEAAAITYATNFNTHIGGTCVYSGGTNVGNLADAWSEESETYSGLAAHVKYWLTEGYVSSTANANIVTMMGKYDYVYGKYHSDLNNNDFLGRNPASLSAVRDFSPFTLFGESEETMSTVIIIISSSIALLSITALSILVIKKRKSKEQE